MLVAGILVAVVVVACLAYAIVLRFRTSSPEVVADDPANFRCTRCGMTRHDAWVGTRTLMRSYDFPPHFTGNAMCRRLRAHDWEAIA